MLSNGFCDTTTTVSTFKDLPVSMRIEPTASFSGDWRVIRINTATAISSGPTIVDAFSTNSGASIAATVGSTALTAGQGISITANSDVDAHLILDSEL